MNGDIDHEARQKIAALEQRLVDLMEIDQLQAQRIDRLETALDVLSQELAEVKKTSDLAIKGVFPWAS